MTVFQSEQRFRLHREKTKEAISLALQSRWEEAIRANHELLAHFPDDVDTINRLGRALAEVGRYTEARDTFQRALQLAPKNAIAQKNLNRLMHFKDGESRPKPAQKTVAPLFIEESGKTGLAHLMNLPAGDVLARVSAGGSVHLVSQDSTLLVRSDQGEFLGQVEPRLAMRLVRLIRGGNRYSATITSVSHSRVTILIREVYRHPSQAGITSFPCRTPAALPYAADAQYTYDADDELVDGERPPLVWSDADEDIGPLAEDRQVLTPENEPDASTSEGPSGAADDEESA